MALTVVGCIHLIAERKAIGPIELCAILRRVKHWFVEQVWVAPNQKALVSTIRVFTANIQVMKHALEYIHRRLRIEDESKVTGGTAKVGVIPGERKDQCGSSTG